MTDNTAKLNVGIVGVSGYGGGELARLLLAHPHVALTYVTSGTYAGKPLRAALPGAAPSDLVCEEFDPAACAGKCDLVFLAGEAGLAMKVAPGLLEMGKLIVDLSADFRLQDPAIYQEFYKAEHTAPHLLAEAAYGLPEINKDWIANARLVANPGCYPTSAILALAPLADKSYLLEPRSLIVDSLSGVSGAGRSKFSLDYHFAEVNESVKPYGVGGTHRHRPEIEQGLSSAGYDNDVAVTFTPHLLPITRGILTTAYVTFRDYLPEVPGRQPQQIPVETSFEEIYETYRAYYADVPFVVLRDPGHFPATKHVYGTNYCHIGLAFEKRTNRIIVVSAIDNLVKGAAGQAIQNMNLMCEFDETAGLTMGAVWP
jgi:N-acetyl-gamma-glutamyl-phosphate reductase